jgi:hypothetical protein
MKKLLLLAFLTPICAFSAHKVDRIDLEPFWMSMKQGDYTLAQWHLNHCRAQTFNDQMYLDLARWYIARQKYDEQGCVCADIDIDADIVEYVEHGR